MGNLYSQSLKGSHICIWMDIFTTLKVFNVEVHMNIVEHKCTTTCSSAALGKVDEPEAHSRHSHRLYLSSSQYANLGAY